MGYYPNTVRVLRERLQREFPGAEAEERSKRLHKSPSHLLWMLEKIEKEDGGEKAARWIGYVLGCMEAMGLLTNQESRGLIGQDVTKKEAKK